MTQQYLRKVFLGVSHPVTGGTPGQATVIDLSNMHIKFQTVGAILNTLKRAEITVYNLSDNTANLIRKEFTEVTLSAGYQSAQYGEIFRGQITRIQIGKENATDSFVRIFAQDSDSAKNFAVTNAALASGWTDDNLLDQLIADFAPFGIGMGYRPAFNLIQGARGRNIYAKAEQCLNELAARQGCDWFIDGGKVNLVKKGEPIPGTDIPVLSPATGLVGIPQLDLNGISARCLLNPDIRQGGQVHIDGTLINTLTQNTPGINQGGDILPELQGQGTYKVMYVVNTGDTRGTEWYTDMICVSTDTTGPADGPGLTGTPEGP